MPPSRAGAGGVGGGGGGGGSPGGVRVTSPGHPGPRASSPPAPSSMSASPSTSSLSKPLEVLALPGMYLVYKYHQFKRQQQENSKRRVAEKELNLLNQKIDKLLAKLDDQHEGAPETATETPITPAPDDECVVCLCAKATMQTFPCGHKVVCRKCFVKTIQVAVTQRCLPLRCVVCRSRVLKLKQSAASLPSKSPGKGQTKGQAKGQAMSSRQRQGSLARQPGAKSAAKQQSATMRQAQQLARDMHKKGFAVAEASPRHVQIDIMSPRSTKHSQHATHGVARRRQGVRQ